MKNIIIAIIMCAIAYVVVVNYENIMLNLENIFKNEKTISKVVNTRDANQKLEEDIYKNPENY